MSLAFQYKADQFQQTIDEELNNWQQENKTQRLWEGDASLWTNSDEGQWLGWLDVSTTELKDVSRIEDLVSQIKSEGYKHLVVLGMGGSSLTPAMMAETFGKIDDYPDLQILDSTDPMQIQHLQDCIDLKKTCFIVSSKSGTTLEPNIFKEYFYSLLQSTWGKLEVGHQFIAITDPGSALESSAKSENFRAIFQGIPSIGGRYSALSNFGMIPAGLMGVSVKDFLYDAEKMAQTCSASMLPKENPGVLLGIILGVCAKHGKDKVTLIVSPGIKALGAWLEQLLAESTGKLGKGLIPIVDEPLGHPDVYGKDRVFIYIRLEASPDVEQDKVVTALEQSNQVMVRLKVQNKEQLGAELFRWEMATAVAGSMLSINPFNQPDVEGSKKLAVKLIEDYTQTGKIQKPDLLFSELGIQLFTNEKNIHEIKKQLIGSPSIETYLRAHLNRVNPGDYVNLSAFIEMTEAHSELFQRCRGLIRDAKKVATCVGFGPRFLHSTGQDYKGGPNTGVFLQITSDHPNDIQIPGRNYSFGLVIDAQAEADFEVLVERGRRVLRVHLGQDVNLGLQQLYVLLQKAILVL